MKCIKFSEDEEDSAPKAYHGELEDDVISSDIKNSNSAPTGNNKVPIIGGGVAEAMTTKTTVQSEIIKALCHDNIRLKKREEN